jgi:[acyl-carrier-protein] S-malonyltransferase
MGRSFFDQFQGAKERFEEASDAIRVDMKKLCFDGSESDLRMTENSQPALLTVSSVIFETVQAEFEISPAFVAGHSLGEYSALVASGALKFWDAVKLVKKRGIEMQRAVPVGKGKMAALMGSDAAAIQEVCTASEEKTGSMVRIANDNAPGQIVIAGEAAGVDDAIANAKELGIRKAVELPVSAPFHTPLMQPAADNMKDALFATEITNGSVPYVSNVDAQIHEDFDGCTGRLVDQIVAQVRWRETMDVLSGAECHTFVELGAGKVLSGLAKRCLKGKDAQIYNVDTAADLDKIKGLAR